jgi:hypothetical protein
MKANIITALLVLIASTASAQDARLARLDAPTRDAVTRLVVNARGRGLPTEALVQKALEGLSKGADGPAISRAVAALSNRMETARTALGTQASEAELVAGAAAVYAGAHVRDLQEIRRANASAPLAMPLTTLAFLMQSGVAQTQAVHLIERLVLAQTPAPEFLRLQQLIENDVRSGVTAGNAAGARVEAMTGGRIRSQ